jgi:hypothetical protein
VLIPRGSWGRSSIRPLATAVAPCERTISGGRSVAPATFVRTAALSTVIPRQLAISSVGARHGCFRWGRRRGSGRSISRPGQPVAVLVLVARLPTLGRRGELRGADLSKILGPGPLLLLPIPCSIQSPGAPGSGPVDRSGDGRRQFGLLVSRGIFAGVEPRENSDWGDPNGALPAGVIPPGEE